MDNKLLINIDVLGAILGFSGSFLLFLFGLPPKVDIEGHQHLILEQVDKKEKEKGKLYRWLGHLGIILITLSFVLQLVKIINHEC